MTELSDIAIATWRLERWINNSNVEKKLAVKSIIRTFNKYLMEQNLEIIDLTGNKFDSGLSVNVISNESNENDEGKLIVKEMVRPIILQEGAVVQYGQVILDTKKEKNHEREHDDDFNSDDTLQENSLNVPYPDQEQHSCPNKKDRVSQISSNNSMNKSSGKDLHDSISGIGNNDKTSADFVVQDTHAGVQDNIVTENNPDQEQQSCPTKKDRVSQISSNNSINASSGKDLHESISGIGNNDKTSADFIVKDTHAGLQDNIVTEKMSISSYYRLAFIFVVLNIIILLIGIFSNLLLRKEIKQITINSRTEIEKTNRSIMVFTDSIIQVQKMLEKQYDQQQAFEELLLTLQETIQKHIQSSALASSIETNQHSPSETVNKGDDVGDKGRDLGNHMNIISSEKLETENTNENIIASTKSIAHNSSDEQISKDASNSYTEESLLQHNYIEYIVKEGDNLYKICKDLNLNYYQVKDEILSINNICDPDKIFLGDTILIPDEKMESK